MYDELIRVLRHCGNPNVSCKGCSDEDDCIGAEGAWEIGAMANMRAAAEAIEELSRQRDRAYARLCEWCGVCPEGKRNAEDCEIAALKPETPKEEA